MSGLLYGSPGPDPVRWTPTFRPRPALRPLRVTVSEPLLNTGRVAKALDVVEDRRAQQVAGSPGLPPVDPGPFPLED